MSSQLRVGQLVAFAGADQPDEYLFSGQPGVIIDLGPDDGQPSVSFEGGLSIGLPEAELVPIDVADYEKRAQAMRASTHPITGVQIASLDVASPVTRPTS